MFLITFVVFVILQLAPGQPGGPAAMEAESASSQVQQSGYRMFKQQFHLDKPILLNFRFLISDQEVIQLLQDSLPETKPAKKRLEAIETLADYGNDIVPHLVRIILTPPSDAVFKRALEQFRGNAVRRLNFEYGKELTKEQEKENTEIEIENRWIAKLGYEAGLSDKQLAQLSERIVNYYMSVMDRWDYGIFGKLDMMLFDTRFARYIHNLLHLDLGISYRDKKPVLPNVLNKLKYSVVLSLVSIFFAYLLSIPIGMYSAVKTGSPLERAVTITLFMLYSLPPFFVGTVLLYCFSEGGGIFKILPTGGFHSLNIDEMTTLQQIADTVWHLVLPVVCLTYVSLASLSRYARTGLLDVIHSDYIKTARAKGLPESVVVVKHALRNGLIPVITLMGTILPTIVGGSVIIEVIFDLPGIGQEAYNAVLYRDYNVVMAIQLISALMTLIGLLISDLLYAVVDPRISYE
jgi:peptide/nickel transport system permease protein